jgi:hypothetical protein
MNKPRLIDANEARKAFDPNTWQGDMMISILDNIPTAYDIDEVIKELIDHAQECTDRITYETHSFVSLFDAIKIVKGGAE